MSDLMLDEFFAEAKRLNLRVLGTPEETRIALDRKDDEIERLRAEVALLRDALATESSRKCATEHDCIYQPSCSRIGKCMRPERPFNFAARKGEA